MEINFKDEKSKKIFEKRINHSKSKNRNHNKGYKKKASFSIDKTKIPKDIREVLNDLKDIDNFNLKLNKFALFNNKDEVKIKEQKINENFFHKNWNFYKSNIDKYYENIQNLSLKFSSKMELKTNYRLVIGSEESIYETSIRLHHIYGIPYIPASAIKGVVRSYYILEKFANKLEEYKDRYNKFEEEVLFKKENGEYKEKCFVDIFGSQEQEGKVIFFDAFPISAPRLKMDIINPMEEDKIINFITVEDTTFKFFIASKDEVDENFLPLFKDALQNHGIGAKSAVGYGYFNEL